MTTTPTVWHSTQRANTTDSGDGGNDQNDSRMVQLSNGNFLVLWTSNTDESVGGGAAEDRDIIAQAYDPLGNAIGGEFRANHGWFGHDEDEFDVAATADGGFIIAYEDTDGSGTSIRATIWEGDLVTFDDVNIANDPGADDLGRPAVSVNDDGSMWVGYQRTGAAGASVFGRLIDTNHDVGPQTLLVTASQPVGVNGQQLESATLVNGNTVFVARHNRPLDDAIVMSIENDNGGSVLNATYVADTDDNGDVDLTPAVAALTDGDFVVAWANTDLDDTDIQFQRYTAAGNTLGTVRHVASFGPDENNRTPAVIGLDDGGFFVAWDNNADNTIEGQRFNASGTAVGAVVTIDPETILNTTSDPALERLQDGRIAVSWTNDSVIGTDQDVDFAIYDPRENSLTYGNEAQALTARLEATTIHAGGGNDTVYGRGATDTLYGEANHDWLYGGGKGDTINAGGGNDRVFGEGGNDALQGAAGNDTIVGAGGSDTINAGGGDDVIVFDTAIGPPPSADHILGFVVADDTIHLDSAIFGLPVGPLPNFMFETGSADDDTDHILYNAGNGHLSFDADGEGGANAQLFAELDPGLALTAANFVVI